MLVIEFLEEMNSDNVAQEISRKLFIENIPYSIETLLLNPVRQGIPRSVSKIHQYPSTF